MADDADITQDRLDKDEEALAKVRKYMAGVRELQPCGACSWCNSYVKGSRLFCSKECSDDHEKAMKQMRAAGR